MFKQHPQETEWYKESVNLGFLQVPALAEELLQMQSVWLALE